MIIDGGPDGFIQTNNIVIKVEILHKIDSSCEMESLTVNGISVGFGNFSDNYCDDRLDAIKKTLNILGIEYNITVDEDWKYE